ncbi:MAG: hypothetical protein ACE3L7_28965 [Candidatus Pristimantibacillus sp.]
MSAGFLGTDGSIDIQQLRVQEITLHCPSGWTKERMDATLAGIHDGWLQTVPLITHLLPAHKAKGMTFIIECVNRCFGNWEMLN